MSGNGIESAGVRVIVDALKNNNTSVKKIDLNDNYVSWGLKKELKELAQEKGITIIVH